MNSTRRAVLLSILALPVIGCASLKGAYEKPHVKVTSFTMVPNQQGIAPKFAIGIEVVNPNRVGLNLRGMSYSVEVENYRILSGAAPDLPSVPAYGSANFVIEASPDLLGSARLISDVLSSQRNQYNYTFKARIDAGSLIPFINVEETGRFNF